MWVLSLFLLVALVLVFSAWRAEVKRNDRLALEKFDLVRELTARIVFKPEPEMHFGQPDPLGQAVDKIFAEKEEPLGQAVDKIFAEKEEMEKMGKELERLLNPPPDD